MMCFVQDCCIYWDFVPSFPKVTLASTANGHQTLCSTVAYCVRAGRKMKVNLCSSRGYRAGLICWCCIVSILIPQGHRQSIAHVWVGMETFGTLRHNCYSILVDAECNLSPVSSKLWKCVPCSRNHRLLSLHSVRNVLCLFCPQHRSNRLLFRSKQFKIERLVRPKTQEALSMSDKELQVQSCCDTPSWPPEIYDSGNSWARRSIFVHSSCGGRCIQIKPL